MFLLGDETTGFHNCAVGLMELPDRKACAENFSIVFGESYS